MDRRMFIDAMTASMVAAPLVAIAQKPAIVRRIGVLTAEPPQDRAELDRKFAPLRALGWVEGQNLLVERRYVSGKVELLQPFADELVRLKVEIIGTLGTPAALAAKNATKTIPIVLWSAGDPVGSGLVASLARPGGNLTGFSFDSPEIDTKRSRAAPRADAGLAARRRSGTRKPPVLQGRARRLRAGVSVSWCSADVLRGRHRRPGRERNHGDGAPRSAGTHDSTGASVLRKPSSAHDRCFEVRVADHYRKRRAHRGGRIGRPQSSYAEQNERFAWFVDKILRGAKPAELPIQQPTRFVLVVNLKAAKALGLKVPQSILLRADEVVE